MTRSAYADNANAPVLSVAGMPAVNAMYCPNPANLRHPMAAPYLAESHADLLLAYIAVAQNDLLRDEFIDYTARLRDAGGAIELTAGGGLIYGYLRALEYCQASRDSLASMSAWLKRQNEAAHQADQTCMPSRPHPGLEHVYSIRAEIKKPLILGSHSQGNVCISR